MTQVFSRILNFVAGLVASGGVNKLRGLPRSNELFLIPMALVTGVLAGSLVTLMADTAQIAHMLIYGIPIDVRLSANASISPIAAILAPACGGLLLGIMEWGRRRLRIANAVDPIEANALRGGRLSLRDSIIVSAQTMISNGCGASVGLEAGYTQIGSGIASIIGRYSNMRRNDVRLMVGCGAAAAISAAFGAPITGAFYACELIFGIYSVASAAPILAASIAGAITAHWLGGAPYSLEVPHVSGVGIKQYFALLALALITSVVGIAVMRSSSVFERLFVIVPVWLRPTVGGCMVGAMAIVTPQVLAAGHGAMVLDLRHDMTIGLIALVIGLKVIACLLSLASGFRGGLFFASLFVGSLIGKLYAAASLALGLDLAIDPILSMLTGMATLGVAIVGGPLTMSFLVLEMTRIVDVTALVLAGCILTSIFVRSAFGHSFSTWRLHLRGETIRSANDIGWLRNLTVENMMRSDVGRILSSATIAEARTEFALGSRSAIVVVNGGGEYVGLIMLPDLFSSDLDSVVDDIQVVELACFSDTVLLPKLNIKHAMAAFDQAEAELLVVVESQDSRKVIGYLTEAFARRRYVEEIDKVTRSVLGAPA